jgi:hypothetical protein
MDTVNLGLPVIDAAQAQKHVTHNEALGILDILVQLAVADRDLSSPPATPAEGARYIVKASGAGAWGGHSNEIAAWQDGLWRFNAPKIGWLAYVADEASLVAWNGTAWVNVTAALQSLTTLGINATADATNRLAVKSNAVLLSHDDVTPGTGDSRVTINKSAAGKDAGFVLQDGFSTRALFGLLGDDDFAIKVSANGSSFFQGITIDKDTGNVAIGSSSDANNRLLVAGAANSLFTNTGDVRLTFSKGAAANTSSLLFQDNFSGRAEIGLTGDDDFHFKVSPNGSTFFEAIRIDRNTGRLYFPVTGGPRELLTANRTYFVRTDGSDSNNGLADNSGGAFLTIQKAINTAAALDMSTFNVTIQVRNGTYATSTGLVLKSTVGAGKITIVGDEATPSNVVVTTNGAMTGNDGVILAASITTTYAVRGLMLTSTATGNVLGLVASGISTIEFQNLNFGSGMAQHIRAQDGGLISATGNYTISGSGGAGSSHLNAVGTGKLRIQSITVTLTGTPAFSSGFVSCLRLGVAFLNGNTFSGSATGKRYDVSENSVVFVSGAGANYLPGDAAGTTATGGQYV